MFSGNGKYSMLVQRTYGWPNSPIVQAAGSVNLSTGKSFVQGLTEIKCLFNYGSIDMGGCMSVLEQRPSPAH